MCETVTAIYSLEYDGWKNLLSQNSVNLKVVILITLKYAICVWCRYCGSYLAMCFLFVIIQQRNDCMTSYVINFTIDYMIYINVLYWKCAKPKDH